MKRYIFATIFTICIASCICSCENIDELPPIKESTSGKSYKLPDPQLMNAADHAAFEAIRAEYKAATD